MCNDEKDDIFAGVNDKAKKDEQSGNDEEVSSRFSDSFFISKMFSSFVTILCFSRFDGDYLSNNELFVNNSYCKISDIVIPLFLAISINFRASATSFTFNSLEGIFEV